MSTANSARQSQKTAGSGSKVNRTKKTKPQDSAVFKVGLRSVDVEACKGSICQANSRRQASQALASKQAENRAKTSQAAKAAASANESQALNKSTVDKAARLAEPRPRCSPRLNPPQSSDSAPSDHPVFRQTSAQQRAPQQRPRVVVSDNDEEEEEATPYGQVLPLQTLLQVAPQASLTGPGHCRRDRSQRQGSTVR